MVHIPGPDDRASKTYFMARIWWCEDEECDCHQPEIILYKPAPPGHWRKIEKVWEGTFFSQPDKDEWDQMKMELREAAKTFNIPLNEELWAGEREA